MCLRGADEDVADHLEAKQQSIEGRPPVLHPEFEIGGQFAAVFGAERGRVKQEQCA